MNHATLHATERRLVTLFVGGAFLFLLIFEGIFLGGRIILENKFLKQDFERSASRVLERIENTGDRNMRPGRPGPIDIGFLTIDASGNIRENKLGGVEEFETIEAIMDMNSLSEIPFGETVSLSGFYIKKVVHPRFPDLQTIFIKSGGYDIDDILRDIFRFLALNMLILVPFWFLGRYFVRETLKPVAENMDAMSHFIHDAGHELKTPLAILGGNLQILRDMKGKDSELITTSIETIYSMANSLDGLIELSSLKKPKKPEEVSVKKSIDSIIALYAKEIGIRDIHITKEIPENAIISMEGKHFSILVSNLLKNAIMYNKEGGSILIKYEKRKLSIEDTGIGMSQDEKGKIFDRFYRSDRSGKLPGSGIGLAIVDRIIRLYGWKISVESTLNIGTKFVIDVK